MTAKEIIEQKRILLKAKVPEKQIAAIYGLTTMELRKLSSNYLMAERIADTGRARVMKKEGMTNKEIAEIMGKTEATIRLLLMTEEERKEQRKLKNNVE